MKTYYCKDIEKIEKDNKYDEYGYCLHFIDLREDTNTLKIAFYSINPESNYFIIKNDGGNRILYVRECTFSVDCSNKSVDFEKVTNDVAKMNIAQTIEYLVRNFPKSTLNILSSIPADLFANKDVMKRIILALPVNPVLLEDCNKVFSSTLKKIQEIETIKRDSAKAKTAIFETYNTGLKKINAIKQPQTIKPDGKQ